MGLVSLLTTALVGASVSVGWQYNPDENVNLKGFSVQERVVGSTAWSTQTVGPEAREASFPAVEGDTYEVEVEPEISLVLPPISTISVPKKEVTASCGSPTQEGTSVKITLTSDKTGACVLHYPSGTSYINWAYMPKLTSSGSEVKYAAKATGETFTPPSGDPVVDAVARTSANANIGSWAGRIETTPTSPPPPPPPSGKLTVSLSAGGWGSSELTDLMGVVNTIRVENAPSEELNSYATNGYKAIDLINHYASGVKGINRETYAGEVLSVLKAHTNIRAVELLNEPQNIYFWGSEAESLANIEAYAALVNYVTQKVKEAFTSGQLSYMPALLWSADGGFKGIPTWGKPVFERLNATARELASPDVHPYGGTGERAKSAEGGRSRVREAHELTGKLVWVTEVGWPTCVGCANTGDSLQWTEAEQAANIQHFYEWAVAYAGVADVTIFNYVDYGTNDFYGIETSSRKHKISYGTLKEMSAKYAN